MPSDYDLRLEGAYRVIEWMRVRTESGYATDGYSSDQLKCELDHSSLIHWLCAGHDALPDPPPVRFSRPDHQAGLEGKFEPYKVHEWTALPGSLVVDQEGWKILETKGPDHWIGTYRLNAEHSRWSVPWSIRRVSDKEPPTPFHNGCWIAERLP